MRTLVGRALTGVVGCVIACTTTACLSYQEPLSPLAAPSGDKGYLYGRFVLRHEPDGLLRLSLLLTELRSGAKVRILCSEDEGISVIDVPPGQYQITHYTLALEEAVEGRESSRQDVPFTPPHFGAPFTVEPNHLYYIGEYIGSARLDTAWASARQKDLYFRGGMQGYRDSYGEATLELKARYQNLRALPTTSVSSPP